jgi:hypothetical protein
MVMNILVKNYVKPLIIAAFLAQSLFASASTDPSGLWKTHDDKGKPTGYVRVQEDNGIYTGIIEKGLDTDKEEKVLYCLQR